MVPSIFIIQTYNVIILFIFETEKFRNNIETALSNYRRASNTIKYLDYTKDQNNLTVFNKSNEYAFEKEFRFVFYPNENLFFQKKIIGKDLSLPPYFG